MKQFLINIAGNQFFIKCDQTSIAQLPNGLAELTAYDASYNIKAKAMSTSIVMIEADALMTPEEMEELRKGLDKPAPGFDAPVPMSEPAPDFEFVEVPRHNIEAPPMPEDDADLPL